MLRDARFEGWWHGIEESMPAFATTDIKNLATELWDEAYEWGYDAGYRQGMMDAE